MKQLMKCCGGCIAGLLWVTVLVAQPTISRVEYYIDNDPGYDNGKSIDLTADTNLTNLTLNIDPSTLKSGVHLLGIRAKDINGGWSQDNKWLFGKPYAIDTVTAGAAPFLKQVEYYIDIDPGYGKGIPLAIDSASNLADVSLAVNISGLSTGDHNLFIRSKDVNNGWSPDNVLTFTTGAVVASPSIVINSIVKKALCQQDTLTLAYHAKGNYGANNIFNVELSDASGGFSAPTIIGSLAGTASSIIRCTIPPSIAAGTEYKIRISSTSPVVTGLPATDLININNLPVPVITPADTIVIKLGDSVTLATTSGYDSYLWSTSAQSSTIIVRENGVYSVKVTTKNGCSGTSAPVVVKVAPAITASGAVSNICPGTSVTLTSSLANNYLWNTAETTQSITATIAGVYYVVVNAGNKGDTSAPVTVTNKSCGNPGSLSATNISVADATLNWAKVTCAQRYQLRYRLSGTTAWTTVSANTGATYTVTGLVALSTYQWQVRTVCADSSFVVSKYSSLATFTTNASLLANNFFTARGGISPAPGFFGFSAMLFPNPTNRKTNLRVTGNNTMVTVLVTDITGKVLWKTNKITNSNLSLPVEDLTAGTYLVIIKDGKTPGNIEAGEKLIKVIIKMQLKEAWRSACYRLR